jgi:hypothetical protein
VFDQFVAAFQAVHNMVEFLTRAQAPELFKKASAPRPGRRDNDPEKPNETIRR